MNNIKNYNEIIQELKKNNRFERYENDAKIKLNVGIEVLRARKNQNLSQGELAKNIATTQKVISKIENGEVDVGVCMLSRISKNLNLTTENFANIFECERIYTMSMSTEACSSHKIMATGGDFHSNNVWEDDEEKLSEKYISTISYTL